MLKIAILGFGVVGSGVAQLIHKNNGISDRAGKNIVIKKILEIRDVEENPENFCFTKDPEEIFSDSEIEVVVEVMGGIGKAYEYTKRALLCGKSVVTSNKELVATYGPELTKIASENGVSFLFEASVGGGIPIIRPINNCLAANEILSITGILNGTTNFILWKMEKEGMDFREALKEAQSKGYAEADPTSDIEGFDTVRKLAILSCLAYEKFFDYKNIKTEGIGKLAFKDIKCANAIDGTIKLVAKSEKKDDAISAWVSPVIIKKDNLLANVDNVFNAILVEGDAVGETLFYGKGAGKYPTASAVVADILDIARKGQKLYKFDNEDFKNIKETEKFKFLIRINTKDLLKLKESIKEILGEAEYLDIEGFEENEVVFTTKEFLDSEIEKVKELILLNNNTSKIESILKILN